MTRRESRFFFGISMYYVSQFFYCAIVTKSGGVQRLVSGVHKTSSSDGMKILAEVRKYLEKEYSLTKENIAITNLNKI